MAASDVTIAQNGGAGAPAKLHPYIFALVRWCVSCFWSTATIFLHRLIAVPITPIAGIPSTKQQKRPASKDHLDPEPKVECVVLHEPAVHSLDVIFVHGLYGSLNNTWRQGEWRSKYINGPETVPLRRSNLKPSYYTCDKCTALNKNNVLNVNNDAKNYNIKSDNDDRNEFEEKLNEDCYKIDKTAHIDDRDSYKSMFNDNEYKMNNNRERNVFELTDNEENIFVYDSDTEFSNIGEKFYKNIEKILPKDDVFVTEKFYNNTLLNQVEIISNYETQAEFVRDLFKNSCESENNEFYTNNHGRHFIENNEDNFAETTSVAKTHKVVKKAFSDTKNSICQCKANNINEKSEVPKRNSHDTEVSCKCTSSKVKQLEVCSNCNETMEAVSVENKSSNDSEVSQNLSNEDNQSEIDDKFKSNDEKQSELSCKCITNEGRQCEVGCGCICDECYSPCWPRDWIKVDYPDARVISINYTSDPYLWRPLWVKEIKRLRLHERADQMTQQLIELGVGEKPVIWVGHSKGGLFIKQIYCDAYEAYLKQKNKDPTEQKDDQNVGEYIKDNEINQNNDSGTQIPVISDINNDNITNSDSNNKENNVNNDNNYDIIKSDSNNIDDNVNNEIEIKRNNKTNSLDAANEQEFNENSFEILNEIQNMNEREINSDFEKLNSEIEMIENDDKSLGLILEESKESDENVLEKFKEKLSASDEEDTKTLAKRSRLWSNSAGFMFYSVPHRGSPLADIKTPLTARSVELMEITKDCSLVLNLQERWERAGAARRPLVRSLVETRRTLMSVLWLRIVSYDSADPGIGALCGVSVDHREICKPSSRHCLLYKELATLIRAALNKCQCEKS